LVIESAEELLKRVSEGWKVYPDHRTGRWRVKFGNRSEYISRELEDLARKMYTEQRVKAGPEGVEGGEGFEEQAPKAPAQSRRGWGTGTSEVLRALGEEYAAIIKTVTEKTRWFAEALVEVGWVSTLMAFQFARVEPKDIPLKIAEFTESKEFVKFVVRNLNTLIEANYDAAQAIAERDGMNTRLNNAAKFLAFLVAEWRKKALMLAKELQVAHVLIEKYGLINEYLNLVAQFTLVESALAPQQQTAPMVGGGEK
jgi:hypothetical protein